MCISTDRSGSATRGSDRCWYLVPSLSAFPPPLPPGRQTTTAATSTTATTTTNDDNKDNDNNIRLKQLMKSVTSRNLIRFQFSRSAHLRSTPSSGGLKGRKARERNHHRDNHAADACVRRAIASGLRAEHVWLSSCPAGPCRQALQRQCVYIYI